ncbi:MAG: hypothetical protein AB1625_11685, partial [Acidobacteriota bacterium]
GTRPDLGLLAGWGMAALVVAGGVLNLAWGVSPATLKVLVAIGAGAGFHEARRRSRLTEGTRGLRLLGGAAALLAAVQVAGSLHGAISDVTTFRPFDVHDDAQAYLPMAVKLTEQGSLGPEPFEARRLLNLGGQTFLQTLVLAGLPLRALHLLDAGVGMAVLVALAWGHAARRRVDWRLAPLLLLPVLALPHLEIRGNTSAVLTGTCLLLAWYRTASLRAVEEAAPPRRAATIGLLAAGLAGLKGTFVPVAALAIGFDLALRWREGRRPGRALLEAAATGAAVVAMLLPWMVSLYQSSGTLHFPLLGQGFYAARTTNDFAAMPGLARLPVLDLAKVAIGMLAEALPLVLLLLVARRRGRERAAFAIGAACLLAGVVYVFAADANLQRSLHRYAFPMVQGGLVVLLASALAGTRGRPLGARPGVAAATAVWLLASGADAAKLTYARLAENVADALAGAPLATAAEHQVARQILAPLPAGATVLTRLRTPYLLDLGSRPVFLMGLPGFSSPPPGMPLDADPEALAAYLAGRGVPYLAASYRPAAGEGSLLNLSEQDILDRYPHSRVRWTMLRFHQAMHADVLALMRMRHRLFDSGADVLLDLTRPVTTVVVPEELSTRSVWTAPVSEWNGPPVPLRRGERFLALWRRGWMAEGDVAPEVIDVRVNGIAAAVLEAGPVAVVAELPEGTDRIESLAVALAGARPARVSDGRPAGLDLVAVEAWRERPAAAMATRRPEQAIEGELRPERAIAASGFHADFNWTDGDAELRGLRWPVPSGATRLVVACHAVHPFLADTERLALRVQVDGLDAPLVGRGEREFFFALPPGVSVIGSVRIRSATFVPGVNGDARSLGLPIESLRVE